MAINENWNIRSRAHACAGTGQAFKDGEAFMTVLMEDGKTGELLRRDYSLAAWAEMEPVLGAAFSVWRSEYEAVKTEGRPEIAEKESAETLLRRLCEEDSIMTEKTRYILAVMLERKKQLKQTGTRETEDAAFLVYEHVKSGEVYIVRDPELKLAQLEEVQHEVSRLLVGGAGTSGAEGITRAMVPAPEPTGKELAGGQAGGQAGLPGEAELAGDDVFDELSDGTDVVVDEVPEREVSGEGVTSEEMSERGN